MAENFRQVRPGIILRPIVFSLILSLVVYYGFLRIFQNKQKAGAITTFSIFIFFTYGRVFSYLIDHTEWFKTLHAANHLLLVLASILLVMLAAKLYDHLNIFDTLTLTAVCLTLLIMPSIDVGKILFAEKYTFTPVDIQLSATVEDQPFPDIYHIVVDAYSREDYLMNIGFDNASFINFLRSEGFYVADCTRSNYSRTALSLSSTLNLDYLWRVLPGYRSSDRDDAAIYSALSNNLVHNELQDLGYQFITTENGYPWSEYAENADLFVKRNRIDFFAAYLHPFEYIFIESSALRLLTDLFNLNEFLNGYLINGGHYERVKYSLDFLEKIPTIPGPKYVFFHLTVPHYPFIFSPEGSISPEIPGEAGYIRNIQFINNALEPLIHNIIQKSELPPVIILQGDHGSMMDGDYRFHILYALYLPHGDASLYPTISPVNTYRIVFNQLFNTNFRLLEDESIRADIGTPFRKKPVKLSAEALQCP